MSVIFPQSPYIPAIRQDSLPVCEWVMPAPAMRRDYLNACQALPSGMPDCVDISIVHVEDGIERCTAVIYGRRAYLIHYAFKPHDV